MRDGVGELAPPGGLVGETPHHPLKAYCALVVVVVDDPDLAQAPDDRLQGPVAVAQGYGEEEVIGGRNAPDLGRRALEGGARLDRGQIGRAHV